MSATLLVVGHDPITALGARLADVARAVDVDALDALAAAEGPVGIVVGAGGDTATLARRALTHGVPVLIEAVGRLTTDELAELDGTGTAFAALRRRFESDARWSRGRVAAGGIGLAWGVHAEALASRAPDPLTEALDLLDACAAMVGCQLVTARRFDRGRGAPATWTLDLAHGVSGQLVVRMADRRSRVAGGPELATIRILASHGLVAADLDGPLQRTHGRRGPGLEHVGADGAQRLLAAFDGVVTGTGGPAPVTLGAIAEMHRSLGMTTRRTRTG